MEFRKVVLRLNDGEEGKMEYQFQDKYFLEQSREITTILVMTKLDYDGCGFQNSHLVTIMGFLQTSAFW